MVILKAVRDDVDLNNMAVPRKYLTYGDFKDYYNGTKLAPILTLVVGGNHEATNHLFEKYSFFFLSFPFSFFLFCTCYFMVIFYIYNYIKQIYIVSYYY